MHVPGGWYLTAEVRDIVTIQRFGLFKDLDCYEFCLFINGADLKPERKPSLQ